MYVKYRADTPNRRWRFCFLKALVEIQLHTHLRNPLILWYGGEDLSNKSPKNNTKVPI